MISFAGWEMPAFYTNIAEEHNHTRTKAGLFDVSHMGQIKFYGENKDKFLEYLTPSSIQNIGNNTGKVTVMLNENGGIKDDCVIFKKEKYNHITINACNFEKDMQHISLKMAEFKKKIEMEVCSDYCMIALQGPLAANVLKHYVPNIQSLYYLQSIDIDIREIPVQICRCGYTGEDGFEISVHMSFVERLVELLLQNEDVKLIGLGARDTLRIEAGMCLYGHEITENINLVEAGLSWILSKERMKLEDRFIGYDVIKKLRENSNLVTKKRVGIISKGGPCAREKTKILSLDGNQEIGEVVSGCPSPTLGVNIAQGYVDKKLKPEDKVKLKIRNKEVKGIITKMPFIKTNYYRKLTD
jgi:glycine cleavage system T protein (aminomethyltransferase)